MSDSRTLVGGTHDDLIDFTRINSRTPDSTVDRVYCHIQGGPFMKNGTGFNKRRPFAADNGNLSFRLLISHGILSSAVRFCHRSSGSRLLDQWRIAIPGEGTADHLEVVRTAFNTESIDQPVHIVKK